MIDSRIKRRLEPVYYTLRNAYASLVAPGRKRETQRRLRTLIAPHRLHVGCGRVRFDGWVNIDIDPLSRGADLLWDLNDGIPFDNRTCTLIYSEHVIEHMTVEDGLRFLRECHRVLRPGGILRVATPSLDVLIEKSHCGDWRDQDWLTWPQFRFVKTRAEMLNISFRWWGHLWLYDREELYRRLREAGFDEIRDVEWGKSSEPELANRETRLDSLLICEAIK